MYVNGIQCDACNKIHNQKVSDYVDVPSGWFFVREGKKFQEDGNVLILHFCSLHCLGQWTRSEEDKSTEGNSDNEYWRES